MSDDFNTADMKIKSTELNSQNVLYNLQQTLLINPQYGFKIYYINHFKSFEVKIYKDGKVYGIFRNKNMLNAIADFNDAIRMDLEI